MTDKGARRKLDWARLAWRFVLLLVVLGAPLYLVSPGETLPAWLKEPTTRMALALAAALGVVLYIGSVRNELLERLEASRRERATESK